MAEQSLEDNKHSDDGEPAVQNCEESTARLFLPDMLNKCKGLQMSEYLSISHFTHSQQWLLCYYNTLFIHSSF